MIYLSIAIGLPPDGSSTVHIHTQTIHDTKKTVHRTTQNMSESYFFSWLNSDIGPRTPELGSWITLRHATLGGTPLDV